MDVAGPDGAVIPKAVGMVDSARKNVGDGFNAAMRVPGESGEIVVRHVVAEIVEQQERVEFGRIAKTERAPQADTGAFQGWF